MVKALQAFQEFCYIAHRNIHDTKSLVALSNALECFHKYRVIFMESGVRIDGFALPRQHSLDHYLALIWAFAAPNGLCSSITESKHIKAVKEPWRRSSRFEALGQMLVTNQQLDKLAASRVDFTKRGMLKGTILENMLASHSIGLSVTSFWWCWFVEIFLGECGELCNEEYNGSDGDGNGHDDNNNNNNNNNDDDDDNDDDSSEAVAGPKVLAHVDLAKTVCKWLHYLLLPYF